MEGRPNGGGGGNRPETRARGNAPQLHEKYKAMARDAQLAGDRVQTEYYLQFADHYYRILNENRPRFDEQRPQRENGRDDGGPDQSYAADDYDDEDGESGDEETGGRNDPDEGRGPRARDNGYDRDARPQRDARPPRDNHRDGQQREGQQNNGQHRENQQRDGQAQRDGQQPRDDQQPRSPRPEREDRPQRTQSMRNGGAEGPGGERPRSESPRPESPRTERTTQPERDVALGADEPVRDIDAEAAPARVERPRRTRAIANGVDRPQAAARPLVDAEGEGPGIDLDRLPPAISRPEPDLESDAVASDEVQDALPVRRPRRPREAPPAEA